MPSRYFKARALRHSIASSAPYGQAFADAMAAKNNVALTDAQYDKAGEKFIEIDA